jgi:arabinogalactan endo-1,4-beta-galactosidase
MRIQRLACVIVAIAAGAAISLAQTPPDGPTTAPSATAGPAPQAPATPAAPAPGRGRGGRGAARGPAPQQYPTQIQDTVTGQWYTPQRHAEYAFGADLSSLRQAEARGRVQYKDNGTTKPAMQIFNDHGYNWVRLRVCTPPARLPQDTAYAVAMAKDAKKLGMKVLLAFHYSDGWSDPRPNNHPIPSAWRNLSHPDLVKALFDYTRDTIAAFAKDDVLPDMVQIGNEVSNGFMAPAGQLPEQWDHFADLVYAGVNGVDAGRGNGKRPRIMIHVDHGGDLPKTKAFFDKIAGYDIPYDTIGFSFYPWSHGNLLDLKENLAFAAKAYQKDVIVVETGYCHAPSNYFRFSPGPFPETPEGQAQFVAAVNAIVMNVPEGRGKGIFYWEPSDMGLEGGRRAFFDADGNTLPVMTVFQQYVRPVHRTDDQ